MNPLVLYISGPMSGLPDLNFPAFFDAAQRYRDVGNRVVNPAELKGEGEDRPYEWYLRRDLAELLKCDVIVMLPGWEYSRGARLERHVAEELGMDIIYDKEHEHA